jgi:RsiW-degrading membrane proteinase PrsW (M82 family)
MPAERKNLPSVLMILLSTLGVLISLALAAASFLGSSLGETSSLETQMFTSLGVLALTLGLLNIPVLVYSIRDLQGRESQAKYPSLFRAANFALILWAILLAAGTYLNRTYPYTPWLAPITILCVLIPVWWLIEFARRKLTRPVPLYEWKTLTVGLTLAPITIMIIETLMVIVVAVVVIILLGFKADSLSSLTNLTSALDMSGGGMEQLDQLLYDLSQNPTVASALYLVIGLLAPFTEELFKPLAVWLSWKRPMRAREGFVLGLISGGAFTLLESASLVSQINANDWLSGVVLRSSTGMLHIGLSGLVGYGIAKARSEKRWGSMLLTLLGATGLHGLWNSMALLNGFSTTALPMTENITATAGSVISLVAMALVFATVVFITIRLNKKLRLEQAAEPDEIADLPDDGEYTRT